MLLPRCCSIITGSNDRKRIQTAKIRTNHVDSHGLLATGGFNFHDQLPQHQGSGVAEKHVDPAVTFHCLTDQFIDLRLIGYIVVDGKDVSEAPLMSVAVSLSSQPVDLLPIPAGLRADMHRFGLHTLGDMAALKVKALTDRFGSAVRRAWEFAQGIDDTPLGFP